MTAGPAGGPDPGREDPGRDDPTGPLPTVRPVVRPAEAYDDLPITFNQNRTTSTRTSATARQALRRMRRLVTHLRMRRQDPRIEPYLLDGERVVIIDHRHIASIFMPASIAVAAFFGLAYVWRAVPPTWDWARTLLALAWLVLAGWAVWSLVEWRTDWFVATDKRLLKVWGIVARHVPMMPLSKVTDMTFVRTVPGRIFGYGRFVLESAGQDQALREINYVRNPEETYRRICAEMFSVDDRERVLEIGDDGDDDADYAEYRNDEYGNDSGAGSDSGQDGRSRAIPVQPKGGETLYSSLTAQEEERRRHQLSHTGPLPVEESGERRRRDNSGNQD